MVAKLFIPSCFEQIANSFFDSSSLIWRIINFSVARENSIDLFLERKEEMERLRTRKLYIQNTYIYIKIYINIYTIYTKYINLLKIKSSRNAFIYLYSAQTSNLMRIISKYKFSHWNTNSLANKSVWFLLPFVYWNGIRM